ncbi:hypothetical protein B0T13DRAFT_448376 [Neurospora crassa]|nr:hypothetical protein B0T13DRAFT_448376 [Neurospora crassa]
MRQAGVRGRGRAGRATGLQEVESECAVNFGQARRSLDWKIGKLEDCEVGEKTDRINGDKLRYGPIMDDVGVVGVGVVSRRKDVPREQEGWKVGSGGLGGLGGLQLLPRTIRGGVAVARSTEVREVAAHCRRDSLET